MKQTISFQNAAPHIQMRLLPYSVQKTTDNAAPYAEVRQDKSTRTIMPSDTSPHAEIRIPHTQLVIRFFLEGPDKTSEIIPEDILRWNITEANLLRQVLFYRNNEAVLLSMEEAIGIPVTSATPELIIITNKTASYGASAVLYPKTQKQLNMIYPKGYWLIPSSVHEMIALEANLISASYIKQMVAEVNQSIVSPDDFLANGLFQPDPIYGLKTVRINA